MQKENNNIGALSAHQACASCKHQRKKCAEDCVMAPLFPAEKTLDFQAVHKLFGVSNVSKLLKSIPREEDRKKAADSLVWEANCRKKDLVQGPYGEYKRVLEELKSYKNMYRGMVLNGGTNIGWNNNNGPSKGLLGPNSNNNIGPIGGGHVGMIMNNPTNISGNNYNVGMINDGANNGSSMMIESNRAYNNFPMRVHVSDKLDNGSLTLPSQMHSINNGYGMNQHYNYLTSQYNSNINGKASDGM